MSSYARNMRRATRGSRGGEIVTVVLELSKKGAHYEEHWQVYGPGGIEDRCRTVPPERVPVQVRAAMPAGGGLRLFRAKWLRSGQQAGNWLMGEAV